MPWVRFEPDYPTHEKITPLSSLAKLLDVFGIMYSSAHLRDGRLSQTDIATVAALAGITRPLRPLRELVEVNRWDAQADGGYLIHDILEYQPPREQVLADRAAAAERKRDARLRRPGPRPAGHSTDSGPDSGRSPATLVPGTGSERPYGTSGDPPGPPAEQGGHQTRRRGRRRSEPEPETPRRVSPEDAMQLGCAEHADHWTASCDSCVSRRDASIAASRDFLEAVLNGNPR